MRFAPTHAGQPTATLTLAGHTVPVSGTGVVTPPPPPPTPPARAAPRPPRRRHPTPPAVVVTPPPPAALQVTLLSASQQAKTARLRVRCDRACTGTATIKRAGKVVGRASFSGAAGRTVSLRVNVKGRGGRLAIRLDARDRNGSRASVSRVL